MIAVAMLTFVVRSARPVAALVPVLLRAVQNVDPELPIHQVASMRDIIQRSMTLERAASVQPSVTPVSHGPSESGAPGRTRTCDPRLRRPVLYPPELRARMQEFQC